MLPLEIYHFSFTAFQVSIMLSRKSTPMNSLNL